MTEQEPPPTNQVAPVAPIRLKYRALSRAVQRLLSISTPTLVWICALGVLGSMAVIPATALIGTAATRARKGGSVVAPMTAALAFQTVGSLVTYMSRNRLFRLLKAKSARLRERTLAVAFSRPIETIRDEEPSLLGSIIVTDVEQVDWLADQLFGAALPALVVLVSVGGLIAVVAPAVTLTLVLCIVPIVVYNRRERVRITALGAQYWTGYHDLTKRILRLRRAQDAIVEAGAQEQAIDAEHRHIERFRDESETLSIAVARSSMVQTTLIGFGAGIMLIVSAVRLSHGGGGLIAVLFALAIGQSAARTLSSAMLAISTARPSFERLRAILDGGEWDALQPSVAGAVANASQHLKGPTGRVRPGDRPVGDPGSIECPPIETIELRDVSYCYPSDDEAAIQSVDVRIGRGERLILVGGNGSGKSTVLRVLTGAAVPTAGEVLVNGRPLATFDQRSYRRRLAVVGQQPRLVSGTIEENLRLFGSTVSEERLLRSLDLVDLTFPLDHEIGDVAGRLSGGQAQRLALARAMLGSPEVVVLDEPGNNLDSTGDELLMNLFEQIPGAAWVVVSHSTNSRFLPGVRVLELSNGSIATEP